MTYSDLRKIARLLWWSLIAAFAVWCAIALRADLARLSFAPLIQSSHLVLFAIILTLSGYALRAARWKWYLKKLGHTLTVKFTIVTYIAGFAFALSPAKFGEVIRASFYKEVGISFQEVTAAVFTERLMDVLAMSLLALLAATITTRYQWIICSAAIGVMVGVALLTVLPLVAIRLMRLPAKTPAIARNIVTVMISILLNARALLNLPALLFGLTISLAAWSLEGFGLSILSQIVDSHQLDAPLAVGIYAASMLIGALSFLPGGLGSTEAALTASLLTQDYSIQDALLVVLACRIATLWLGILLGWIAVIVLRRRTVGIVPSR